MRVELGIKMMVSSHTCRPDHQGDRNIHDSNLSRMHCYVFTQTCGAGTALWQLRQQQGGIAHSGCIRWLKLATLLTTPRSRSCM